MPNGASGFVQGLEQGMPYGQVLGDAIAKRRAASRMADLQSQIDSGAIDLNTADGQKQARMLAADASAPLSQRGLDDSYGAGQYDRLRNQGVMSASQAGGQQMNDGDVSGGLMTQARGANAAGDLAGGVQGMGFSGQVKAGEQSVNADGSLDLGELDKGTARNAAMMGNAAGAQQWTGQQRQDQQYVINNLAGTVLKKYRTGGLEAIGGDLKTLATMTGQGDVQYSPSLKAYQMLDKDGNPTLTIGDKDIEGFAAHLGSNTDQMLPAFQAYQAKTAQQSADNSEYVFKKGLDANLDAAKAPFKGPIPAEFRNAIGGMQKSAAASGWTIDTGTKSPKVVNGAEVPGVSTYVMTSKTGEPLQVTVDTTGDAPKSSITTMEGQPVPPQQLAAAGKGAQFAVRAAEMQAWADSYDQQLKERQAQFNDIGSVLNNARGQMGGGGGAMAPGQAAPTNAPNLPSTLQKTPKTPYDALDVPQFHMESGGKHNAKSPKGAYGFGQLMPNTARQLEQQLGMPAGATDTDPVANLTAAKAYRSQLIDGYRSMGMDGNKAVALGLAAYNAGPARVQAFLEGKQDLPAETRKYVSGILQAVGSNGGGAPAQPQPVAQAAQPPMVQVGGSQIPNPFAAVSLQRA